MDARGHSNQLIRPSTITDFIQLWSHFDPDATHQMHADNLIVFIKKLPQPLGIEGQVNIARLKDLGIATAGDSCHIVDVCGCLSSLSCIWLFTRPFAFASTSKLTPPAPRPSHPRTLARGSSISEYVWIQT